MAPEPSTTGRKTVQHPLFILFLALLAISVLILWPAIGAERSVLLGFDLAAAVFVTASFLAMRGASPASLRAVAARNDAGRILLLLVASIALMVILVVVGMEVRQSGDTGGARVALVAGTLTIAWLFGNVVYALHYTHMFYDPGVTDRDHGGLVFPGTEHPLFLDFCYFAFVLGMTFQVSDVQIHSARLRRVATLHALVAFLFNIGIVALTVNIVAGAI